MSSNPYRSFHIEGVLVSVEKKADTKGGWSSAQASIQPHRHDKDKKDPRPIKLKLFGERADELLALPLHSEIIVDGTFDGYVWRTPEGVERELESKRVDRIIVKKYAERPGVQDEQASESFFDTSSDISY